MTVATFNNCQELIDNAIMLEGKHQAIENRKRSTTAITGIIQDHNRSHSLHIMVMDVMGIIIMDVMDIIIMEEMATTIMATIITMGTRVTMAMVEVMVMVMEGIITRATRVCLCRGILAR